MHWVRPDGTPTVPLDDALLDAFTQQAKYAIGCYTASKLTYAHGVLDYYARVLEHPAKAALVRGVPPRHFVPGDWAYLLNTDPVTYEKTGYEGSNAIYLGRGRFDDYYDDHNHSYTFEEKLDEVYQWRNGVFSRICSGLRDCPLCRAARPNKNAAGTQMPTAHCVALISDQ